MARRVGERQRTPRVWVIHQICRGSLHEPMREDNVTQPMVRINPQAPMRAYASVGGEGVDHGSCSLGKNLLLWSGPKPQCERQRALGVETSSRGVDQCGQATKGVWGMPWRQEAKKGVEDCDKPGGVVKRALIPGCPNQRVMNP